MSVTGFRELKSIYYALFGSPVLKYDYRHRILSTITDKLGYRMYYRNRAWLKDPEYLDKWCDSAFAKEPISDKRFILYQFAKSSAEIEGDTAECGVFKGMGSFSIMSANPAKKHWMFDSFSGLSEPNKYDMDVPKEASPWTRGNLDCCLEQTKRNLRSFPNGIYCKGWIPSEFHQAADRTFSMVNIDVDIHQPTKDSLEFFYPRTKGFIILDDFGSLKCPGARKAIDDFMLDKPEKVIHLTTGQGIIIKKS